MLSRCSIVALVVVMVVCASGCASTQLVQTWKDPAVLQPLRKTLVLGLFSTEAVRRTYENQMAAALESHTVDATPASPLLPEADMTVREKVDAVLDGSDFDNVVVTRMVSVAQRERWVSTPAPMPPYGYRGFSDYYWGAVPSMYSPGYITQDTIVLLETNIYRVSDGSLIWSATSETFNPSDADKEVEGLVKVLVDKFEAEGLL